MKYLIFIYSLVFFNHSLYAHEVNEAFFIVKKQGNSIVVESEFPWALRNALIVFNPKLESATDKQEFENTFFQYIKNNLILKDANGIALPFEGFKAIDKNGHSHQNDYILTYKGNSVEEITNTIMFNINNNQVNYITVQLDGEKHTYKTKKSKPTINVTEEKSDSKMGYFLLIIVLIATGLVLIRNSYSRQSV